MTVSIVCRYHKYIYKMLLREDLVAMAFHKQAENGVH